MIEFDHRVAGTSADDWALDDLPFVRAPAAGDHLLVLAAHPDDETLGAGGLIAAAARNAARVTLVVATDGEASHPDSPTTTAQHLAQRRRSEVQAAVHKLAGPDAVAIHFLGLPDGSLSGDPATLAEGLRALLPGVTHLVTPWTGDGHPDHETCGRESARLAAQYGSAHWQYPIWAWHWADPAAGPFAELARLHLTPDDRTAKSAAVDCHVSQHSALSDAPGDEAILAPAVLAHFARDSEFFVITPAHPAAGAAYFERLYTVDDDPWDLAGRFYEKRKRELILAALPRARFGRVFEPGCATGLLTQRLCERSDEVLAYDSSPRAVEQARRRAPAAEVRVGRIPGDWPSGILDLVVLSEVGYYCPDPDELAALARRSLADDGVLVACHWRRPAPDHPHSAETVHAALARSLHAIVEHVEDDFLLTVWTCDGRSVAQQEGIVS